MTDEQVVTITFFRYEGLGDLWWAFQQMGKAPARLSAVEGLAFGKMLGSGGKNGFSIFPNLKVYGLLGVWSSQREARIFFQQHVLFQSFCHRSKEYWTVFMKPVMTHGRWDGVAPFPINSTLEEDHLVGVITRATIHTRHLWRFWRFVPSVSRSVKNQKGLLFSIGIGELPIVQQATFSLWQNSRFMKAYAYQSRSHRDVIRRTRQLGWYKEELFARFRPIASEGSWMGEDPLKGGLF